MMKIPKNLSTEELLESLDNSIDDSSETPDSENNYSDILKFISKFDLDQGEYRVHSGFIYQLYRTFSKNPLEKLQFQQRFVKVFPYQDGKGFYLINKNIVKILEFIKKTKTSDRFMRSKFNPKLINNTKQFLKDLEIKPGNYWVESFILFELYEEYRIKHNKPKYKNLYVTEALGLLLETSRTKYSNFVWFKINKKALDIFDETRYNKYIETKGLEWWKNLPEEVAITEASERRLKAKNAIKSQNRKYKQRYKMLKKRRDAKKNTQPLKLD